MLADKRKHLSHKFHENWRVLVEKVPLATMIVNHQTFSIILHYNEQLDEYFRGSDLRHQPDIVPSYSGSPRRLLTSSNV